MTCTTEEDHVVLELVQACTDTGTVGNSSYAEGRGSNGSERNGNGWRALPFRESIEWPASQTRPIADRPTAPSRFAPSPTDWESVHRRRGLCNGAGLQGTSEPVPHACRMQWNPLLSTNVPNCCARAGPGGALQTAGQPVSGIDTEVSVAAASELCREAGCLAGNCNRLHGETCSLASIERRPSQGAWIPYA